MKTESIQIQTLKYSIKKFFFYLLIAIPTCAIGSAFFLTLETPTNFFYFACLYATYAIMLGLIPVILTAFFLAAYDGLNFEPNKNSQVFTIKAWKILFSEIIFGTILFFGLFIFLG